MDDPYSPPHHEGIPGDQQPGDPASLTALTKDVSAQIEGLYDDLFVPLVKWLHAQFGAGPPEPEDVAQRAFVNLAKRGSLNDIKNTKAFLWRSARNILLSDIQAQTVRTNAVPTLETLFSRPEGDTLDPRRVLMAKEVLEIMNTVIQRMPLRRRRAFVLRHIEGLTYAEITKRLGMTRSNAAKHVVKATQEIIDACEHLDDLGFKDGDVRD